jgi:hypothetical protein
MILSQKLTKILSQRKLFCRCNNMQVATRSDDVLNFPDGYPLVFVVFMNKQITGGHDKLN